MNINLRKVCMAVMLLSISSLSQANLVYEYRVDCHSGCGYSFDVSGVFTFYGDSPREYNFIDSALDFTFIDNTSGVEWGQDDFSGDLGILHFSEDGLALDAFKTIDDRGSRDYLTFINSNGDHLYLHSPYCNVYADRVDDLFCAVNTTEFDEDGLPVRWPIDFGDMAVFSSVMVYGDSIFATGRWKLRIPIERDDAEFLVNEPTALAIFVLGLIGIAARRLKRQS